MDFNFEEYLESGRTVSPKEWFESKESRQWFRTVVPKEILKPLNYDKSLKNTNIVQTIYSLARAKLPIVVATNEEIFVERNLRKRLYWWIENYEKDYKNWKTCYTANQLRKLLKMRCSQPRTADLVTEESPKQ